MKCWQIKETLQDAALPDVLQGDAPYVAALTPEEWGQECDRFSMGIDLTWDVEAVSMSQAQVNYDSLTGSLRHLRLDGGAASGIAFVLDHRGIVFIDRGDAVEGLIAALQSARRWREPSLARFLYDFLESLIAGHLPALTERDARLSQLEAQIEHGDGEEAIAQVNDMRGELLDLRTHYEQLIDVGQELEENENGFFAPEELRFFRMFTQRVIRLQELNTALREYAVQVKDLYHTTLEVRQNRAMNTLTVVTAIFLPLTLIVGWFGMNFVHMPELAAPWGYPGVILLSVVLAGGLLIYFKRKKWL